MLQTIEDFNLVEKEDMVELNKAIKDNKQLKTDLKRMYSNVTPYTLFIGILSAAGTIAYFIVKKSYNNALRTDEYGPSGLPSKAGSGFKELSIPAGSNENKAEG
jgi:hypothetical protein